MSPANPSYAFISDWNDTPPAVALARREYRRRALGIWPGLDRARLRRTNGDPWKIARLVQTRTSLAVEDILLLLMGPDRAAELKSAARGGIERSSH